jgi:hypothetical protein
MRRGYFVRMVWIVIYGYGVPGGALNLIPTNLPDHWDPPLSGKNSNGRTRNRTRDLMINSQKRLTLGHEAFNTTEMLKPINLLAVTSEVVRTTTFEGFNYLIKRHVSTSRLS